MATTRYRCIRLEGVAEHPSNANGVTSIVTAKTDEPIDSGHGNSNDQSLSGNVGCESGEGGYSDNGDICGGGDGGLEAGEGAAINEPDGEERVTAERRMRRRTARKLARQRRQEKSTIQKNTKLQKVEKLDRRTIARRAVAENALQALAARTTRLAVQRDRLP
ncbi:hypothetical protein DVH05_002864 [Phytophthora capsici]|nr:hypothetical protein DVH05_002864 [Phytophthora capsici]